MTRRGWVLSAILGAALFGLLAFAVVAALFAPSAAPSAIAILQIVTVPALVLLLAVVFRPQVAGLLERISELTLPGGAGLRALAQPRVPEAPAKPPTATDITDSTSAATDSAPKGSTAVAVPEQLAQPQELEERLKSMRRQAVFWYSQYLSLFLRPITQAALRWVAEATKEHQVPYSEFIEFLKTQNVTDPVYQQSTWAALRQNNLVDSHGQMINVTRGGRSFLKYMDGEWRPLEQDEAALD